MRGGRAVAVAGVLALVALGGWQAAHSRPSPRAAPTPHTSPSPIPLPPAGFDAPPAGRTGLRLLIGADRLGEYDADSGRTRAVAGVPGPVSGLFAVDGGTVLTAAGPGCLACTVYVVPDHAGAARPLGRYDGAVPAAEPGLVWAYRAGTATTSGTVRLLDLAGRPHGPAYRLPVTRIPVRGTVAGLLLHRVDVGYQEASLWDPATGRLTPLLPDVLAASATHLVFAQGGCADSCTLGWRDVRTGGFRQAAIPGLPVAAAFDPSGQVLAVAAALLDRDANPLTTLYLVSPGRVQRVGASTVPTNRVGLCWSGDRLVAALTPAGEADGPLYLATATRAAPYLRRLGHPTGRSLPAGRCA